MHRYTGKSVPFFTRQFCRQPPPALHSHPFLKRIIALSQTMSLLARAPHLTTSTCSARSNVLVQSRDMHGEYKVRISRWDLRSPGGTLINVECSTSHSLRLITNCE